MVLARFSLTGIAILLIFLAVVTWNRRKEAPGAGACAFLIALMAVYAFGYSGEVAQTTYAGARFWFDVEHLVLPWAPALWLLTALRHNGRTMRTWILFVIPVIDFLGHYTNPFHTYYSGPLTMVQHGPFWVLDIPRGPLSMLGNAYLLLAFVAGAWIYISGLRNASALFRKQAGILVCSSQLPVLGYFIYLTGLSPWGLDLTPFTLAVSCVLFYYGIFHTGIYELAPLARTLIFNSIRDAVLILDMQNRLLDFNPAAQTLLPVLDKQGLGLDVSNLLEDQPEMKKALQGTEDPRDFKMQTANEFQSFELRTWPLVSGSHQIGRAIIFTDVTAQVRLREELRYLAETDSLTGVANRRRFHQALEIECLRSRRNRAPLSVLMVDLDYFKAVNDRYGHPVGDAVLKSVAQRLLQCVRKTDLLARYGGEEFSILLPETGREGSEVIAERVRLAVSQRAFELNGLSISLSVSVGVTSQNELVEADAEILLNEADLALYRAKTAGRNRVEVAQV